MLVTLTSCSGSNFERSNIILKGNKQNGVDPDSSGLDYCVRKNEGQILWFSADCIVLEANMSRCRRNPQALLSNVLRLKMSHHKEVSSW